MRVTKPQHDDERGAICPNYLPSKTFITARAGVRDAEGDRKGGGCDWAGWVRVVIWGWGEKEGDGGTEREREREREREGKCERGMEVEREDEVRERERKNRQKCRE